MTDLEAVAACAEEVRDRYEVALRRIRAEVEDNRIAAIADDALVPKIIVGS